MWFILKQLIIYEVHLYLSIVYLYLSIFILIVKLNTCILKLPYLDLVKNVSGRSERWLFFKIET